MRDHHLRALTLEGVIGVCVYIYMYICIYIYIIILYTYIYIQGVIRAIPLGLFSVISGRFSHTR